MPLATPPPPTAAQAIHARPAASDHVIHAHDAGRERAPAASRLDILIIDDDRDTRVLLDHVCTTAGYRVAHAATGAAGLAIVRTLLPRLVLLDIYLPDDSGPHIAHQIGALPLPWFPTVLYMTAGDRVLPSADGQPLPWVQKPFAFDGLLAQIATLLAAPPASS